MNLYEKETEFMAEYYNKTGIHWRHYFGHNGPRPPPVHYMWPAKNIGDVHIIHSTQGFWTCSEEKEKCQSKEPLKLELEVVSIKPRAFIIENFISAYEADYIIHMAQPKLHHSSVGEVEIGAFESDTRTSDNSWIGRDSSPIIGNTKAIHCLLKIYFKFFFFLLINTNITIFFYFILYTSRFIISSCCRFITNR